MKRVAATSAPSPISISFCQQTNSKFKIRPSRSRAARVDRHQSQSAAAAGELRVSRTGQTTRRAASSSIRAQTAACTLGPVCWRACALAAGEQLN
jgi:hypothetical protein